MLAAELFLVCAMASRSLAFEGNGSLSDIKSSFYTLASQSGNILVVGGDPAYVLWMRQKGHAAFGALTDDWPGTTVYHAVSESGSLAFQTRTFSSVWIRMKNPSNDPGFHQLLEAVRVTMSGGFILFDPEDFPLWITWLKIRRWEALPFRMRGYQIWKGPSDGDYNKRLRWQSA